MSASSASRLMVRSGWAIGTRSSRSMNASIVICAFRRPRIRSSSLAAGFMVRSGHARPVGGVGTLDRSSHPAHSRC